ncbi:MAG TPA: MFS transporter [Gammaproteobacteria bacterium]|nr:MFS transporter [Gammaproteobacteria bacterium]
MNAAAIGKATRTPGSPRAVWSWALFDFANSPFTTLVVTFVYATYFTQAIATDPIRGTELWSRAVAITALIVAVVSPVLGAIADRGGYRKLFFVVTVVVCTAATAVLYLPVPGQVMFALIVFVVANVAFEACEVFYNAFLPDIAPEQRVGFVSGLGWGMGYIGGLLALVVALVTLIQPEVPWFGFTKQLGENIRATNLVVAVWFVVFTVPMLLWVHEDKSRVTRDGKIVRASFAQLMRTFRELRKHRQTVRFLIARLLFNDGLVTVFAFGGIYAAETFGFTLQQVLVFGIVINLTAGIGAFAMGYLDDLIGGKRTIMLSLVGLIGATLLATLATSAAAFWVAGILIGVFAGPNQSASRSLMARFVPHDMENEFFGFFAFSGKLTAFLGPFMLGVLTAWSGSQRVGVSAVIALFLLGMAVLLTVDEREGSLVRSGA